MSEELLQRDLVKGGEKIGNWEFYNIGATTLKALKRYKKIRDIDYGILERKKPDALIIKQKQVMAVIEYKTPKEFRTETQKNKAIKQEIEVAQKLGAKIIIATDTKESVWVNALTGNRISYEDGREIKDLFEPKNEKIIELLEKINDSINEQTDNIKPKQLVNPTDLAKSIWQDIWAVSGATPENCLYTFVELFIFKYLSDLGVLQEPENFDYLMGLYNKRDEDFVLEYYASSIRPKIKKLFPENLIDKTTIINGTIFVSKDQKAVKGYSTTFRTVLEKFHKYQKLEHIDYDFKSQLFESFLKESISKKNWGQFFTPLKVVRSIVEMAKDDIKEGIKMCDPACGVGKFLLEPIVTRLDDFYKITKKGIDPKITFHGFDKGFDRDEQKTIILAKANMLIYFSDLIKDNPTRTKDFAKLFNDSFILKTNSILGTLSEPIEDKYDLILTNPPYVMSGSRNLKDEIKKDGELIDYYKVNAMGIEGLFMEWIIKALKPGGKAFIVVPDGILNRQNDKNLRKFILDECYIDGIISLPIKTFFTTPKKTYILAITKKINKKDIQKEPVFTYLVSEIGESRDIYRFNIDQNDLQEAVTLYSFFKGNKKEFEKINSDQRCKIQPIEKFDPDNHWSIDRWWTKKEQIDLGIIEEDKTVNVKEFGELVGDVSGSLNEFSELLREFDEKKNLKNNYKEILLADKNYFDIFIGKRLVKKELIKIKGKIPIYSANVFNPVGYHIKSNIKKFDNNFVIWGIDGDFEFNFIEKNNPFVTTDHCGAIRIIPDEILPEYLMLQLSKIKHKYGFDRGLRSSLKNMAQVSVKIPLDLNGKIDLELQQEILKKYQVIKETKEKVDEFKRKINKLNIKIKLQDQFKKIAIGDLFYFPSTNSKITKKFCIKHRGEIPVYASSKSENSVLGFIKDNMSQIHYYEDCLSWNRNGSVGYVFIRDHKFATNEDHRAMIIKKEMIKILSKSYLKYEIEKQLFKSGFSFLDKCGVDKIRKVKVSIPIDKNGNFDLEKQEQIAEKYKNIENIKSAINSELDKLSKTEIDL